MDKVKKCVERSRILYSFKSRFHTLR